MHVYIFIYREKHIIGRRLQKDNLFMRSLIVLLPCRQDGSDMDPLISVSCFFIYIYFYTLDTVLSISL